MRKILQALEQFLEAMPEREDASPLLPMDELEERLELIEYLEKYWRENFCRMTKKPEDQWEPLNDHQVASLMTMSLAKLRLALELNEMSQVILSAVCRVPALIKIREYYKLAMY